MSTSDNANKSVLSISIPSDVPPSAADPARAPATVGAALPPHFTRREIDGFHANGYAGPFAICAPEEMSAINARIEKDVLPRPGVWPDHPDHLRHLDARVVYDVAAHPEIVGRVASLWGPDLMLWRTTLFDKPPGGKAVPWHQDIYFWRLDPPLNLTAWIALDFVDEENGCVQVIPGSHTKILHHISSGPEMQFDQMADPASFDPSQAVKMILRPGEFFLFNERLLHCSDPNRSKRHRKCLLARYSTPFVKIPPLCPAHTVVMASGVDRFGFNSVAEPPTT